MAPFHKFDSFVEAVAERKHDLSADVLKVMLTNVLPSASNTIPGDITEIAAGNGYTAGGNVASQISSNEPTPGLYTLSLNNPATWLAVGGSIPAFQYAVLYNDTRSLLIGWYDYGSSIPLGVGESFVLDLDQVNGVLTLQ
jgi:hypothetical protein